MRWRGLSAGLAVEQQRVGAQVVAVEDADAQVLARVAQGAGDQVAETEGAVHPADEGALALGRGVDGQALAEYRQIEQNAELDVGAGLLHQAHLAGEGRHPEAAGPGHGLVAHRFREHVVAEGPLVAPVEGFEKDDRAVLVPRATRAHPVVRKALGPDAPLVFGQLGGGDGLGEADALDARVVHVQPQGGHVTAPFVAGHRLGRRKQGPRPAQDLAVSLETLLDLEGDLAGLENKGGAPGLGVGRVDARDADRPQQQRDEQGDQGGGDDALEHALGYVVAERLHLGSLVSAEKSGPGVPEAWWKMPVKPLRQDRRPD